MTELWRKNELSWCSVVFVSEVKLEGSVRDNDESGMTALVWLHVTPLLPAPSLDEAHEAKHVLMPQRPQSYLLLNCGCCPRA